jgi:hypothetical protein
MMPTNRKSEDKMAQYKISNEKYGETTYFTESERETIIAGLVDTMFPAYDVRQKYLDMCDALEPGEEPNFTEEVIRAEWLEELEEAIEELDCDNHRIIMDNAGGIILQLGEWAHYYNGVEYQVASDIADWIVNRDTSDWEGHEIEALDIDTDGDPINYRVIQIGDDDTVRSLVREMLEHSAWDRVATALVAHLD